MPLTRRELLKGLGLAVGGAGLSAAGYEHLIPFIHQPDNMIPGVSTWYATSCRECPAGCGMLLRSREARVVKAEGNPEHPISRGKLCARGQAALHGLYDPDRLKGPMRRRDSGELSRVRWDEAIESVGAVLARRGRMAFVTDLETGSLDVLMRTWLSALGSDRLVVYEPINYGEVKSASAAAGGGSVVPSFDIAASDYLISFAADFLETWISPIEYARQFASMREVRAGRRGRFMYVGPRVSMTAANADERVIVPPGAERDVALAIAARLGGRVPSGISADEVGNRVGVEPERIRRIAQGLRAASAPLALPGGGPQSARAAMFLNGVLGSTLLDFSRPHALSVTASRSEMAGLVRDMEAGQVDVLVVYSANPAFAYPEPERFVEAMKRVPVIISLSSFMDETSTRAHWILPSHTPLESWGDYQPYPDVVNLMQPTMGAVFDTRHLGDILIDLARAAGIDPAAAFRARNFYEYLRLRWGTPLPPGEGPEAVAPEWEGFLQLGGRWPQGAPRAASRELRVASYELQSTGHESRVTDHALRVWAFPHIYLYDGRGANRWWLQEMPEPVVRAAWSSWAEVNRSTARKLGVTTNDVIEIVRDGRSVHIPVLVWDGVAPDTIAVPLGQGHSAYGRFADGVGVNVYPLTDVEPPRVRVNTTGVRKIVTRWKGADTQAGRDIVETTPLGRPVERSKIDLPLPEGYGKRDFYPGHVHPGHRLPDDHVHPGNRWAMVVDVDRCIGCHACVVACYAENNVGMVGADGIRRAREMTWLRIDRYIDWASPAAPILFQPMLCQHCDSAPCEAVCPVYAAVHSEDGINEQVYNRCVGTRYCANNCPWKVRRFNWFDYKWPEPLNWQLNPDVTVRVRGVMEKCTFCVQRVRQARIIARKEGRPIRDGEFTTACAQTCPTGVFTFGDLLDPHSRVSEIIRGDPRGYQVLHELNTKTAVIYLKKIVEWV